MATLTPDFDDFLPGWIATQRWYRGTGRTPQLRRIGGIRWEDPLGEVGLEDHLLVDESGTEPVVYQVPLSYRAEPVAFLAHALVATAEHDELGTRYVYDAAHDPVFVQTLLQHVWSEHDVPSARARRLVAGGTAPALRGSRVLTGEQSNTSVVVEAHESRAPVLVKLFRVLQSGENPDVTVCAAIARTGNRTVPGPLGYVEGRWNDADGQEVSGHLAVAQEFVAGGRDGWELALAAAGTGEDLSGPARELGEATAQVHTSLAAAFGTEDAETQRTTLVDRLRQRAGAAFAEVDELSVHRKDVERTYDALADVPLPPLQRIHGDLHLGQVLHVPGRGWVLLDFEGEPLRPMAERTAPDLALRDVAGMLRSIDYAAATVAQDGVDATDWARSARAAYLEGYATAAGVELDDERVRPLLDALELDKALYEVVYEARNRPTWVPIPVAAVQRLVAGGRGGRHEAPSLSGGSGDDRPGRHRGEEGPSAADFGVSGAGAAVGADSLTKDSGEVRSSALPEEYAATPGPGDLGPAARSGSADDDQPVAEDEDLSAVYAGSGTGVPGGDADEHDGAGTEQHDGAGTEQHDGAGTEQHDGGDTDEQPGGTDDRPDADEASTPATAHVPASGGLPHAPVPPPEEMVDAFRPTPAGSRPASGGLPHAPVPPPAGMQISADRPSPPPPGGAEPHASVDVARPVAAREYPPASGTAPRSPEGVLLDPVERQRQAWEEASSSPAVVTGRVVRDGDGDGGKGTGGSAGSEQASGPRTVRRTPLPAPQEPAAPHTRPLDLDEATDVVHGLHRSPHHVLGPHSHEGHVTVRTLRPGAQSVSMLLADGRELPMTHETGGIWAAVVQQEQVPTYRLAVTREGERRVVDESYRHEPLLGETDLHLLGEGRHEELWRVLGSHVLTRRDEMGEVRGTHFAVWAPNALAVHVIGDFNGWDGSTHALRVHEDVGVWEIFVPGVGAGAHYKYDITGPDGTRRAKADPMARATEVPPFNNSVVTVSTHRWNDDAWMERRRREDIHHGPMSVYEVHLGSWREGLDYEQLADQLVSYVSEMGFTHVELMPVMQHPYGPSWGYHVTGYFSADSRFGHEDGLRHLIDRLHQVGVGVILDWVPGHFATDPWALARFDGTPIYEHPDPRKGWHPEWGSYIFDYGRPQVRNFLVANACYWLEEFHADGLRVDGVASMLYLDYSREGDQWIPNRYGGRENLEAVELLQETNATAYRRNPGVVMIAEESTSWPGVTDSTEEGGLGFGFKWNMGWMHDTLDYLAQTPYARAHHHHALTFSLVYAFSEKYILPISHDEVVHGKGSLLRKMAGDSWQKFATTRAFLAYQWSHPGKQLLFMGTEFAQDREWADGGTLSWELTEQPAHGGVQRLVRDLNHLYDELPALWQIDHHEDGFAWLDANDASRNLYSYLRWGNEGPDGLRPVVAVLVNFSGVAHHQVHVGLPYGGRWREVLNTDAEVYGGSGQGNMGTVQAYDVAHQRQPWSALVTVPPMGAVWLVPDPEDEPEGLDRAAEDEADVSTGTAGAAGADGADVAAGADEAAGADGTDDTSSSEADGGAHREVGTEAVRGTASATDTDVDADAASVGAPGAVTDTGETVEGATGQVDRGEGMDVGVDAEDVDAEDAEDAPVLPAPGYPGEVTTDPDTSSAAGTTAHPDPQQS
ncbi:1,4-alpha-glucan branching protein GlgB [Ornithinimicrobium sp. W1679]|uniref:1,4-alpha-glucan branching protein GlgB n=1 Tax=Ornithinimicrobium sp. W1679 TaxID=3418770 RepID=UPI003CF92E36